MKKVKHLGENYTVHSILTHANCRRNGIRKIREVRDECADLTIKIGIRTFLSQSYCDNPLDV